ATGITRYGLTTASPRVRAARARTKAPAAWCQNPTPPNNESQRDSDSKPRVARNELPWVRPPSSHNPNGVAAIFVVLLAGCRNPFRVVFFVPLVRRVARSSQP